jgi:methionine--tRNA ligase beta chain
MCEAPPAEAAPAPEREEPFAKLDVRVGKIVEAWPHPDSDKLWCEKIDVGEAEPREIASGIRAYYAAASDLEGKSVLVVCNLKPAKLGGFPSNGMVFCGTSKDKSKVEFVEPPAGAQPGERVVCEGWVMPEPASANQVRTALRGAATGLLGT